MAILLRHGDESLKLLVGIHWIFNPMKIEVEELGFKKKGRKKKNNAQREERRCKTERAVILTSRSFLWPSFPDFHETPFYPDNKLPFTYCELEVVTAICNQKILNLRTSCNNWRSNSTIITVCICIYKYVNIHLYISTGSTINIWKLKAKYLLIQPLHSKYFLKMGIRVAKSQ